MPAQTATFELRVVSGGHAVARLLTCCIGKGLEVVELSWSAGETEATASLGLSGDPRLLERVELWLERLVEVVEVRRSRPLEQGP